MSGKSTLYIDMAKKLAISRWYPEFQKISGSSRNDEILKFCVENQVSWHKLSGINILHVEISQNQPIPGHFWNPGFQGTSGILESWIPGSINHDISSNVHKINTNML